jgi:hypothetical protein
VSSFKSVNLPGIFLRFYKQIRQYDEDLIKAIQENFIALETLLNRGLNPDDNFDWRLITFTSSGTPDAENTIAHDLGKVPTDIVITSVNKAAVVYKGTTAWTNTNVYLKVNVATVAVRAYIFTGG